MRSFDKVLLWFLLSRILDWDVLMVIALVLCFTFGLWVLFRFMLMVYA